MVPYLVEAQALDGIAPLYAVGTFPSSRPPAAQWRVPATETARELGCRDSSGAGRKVRRELSTARPNCSGSFKGWKDA